MRSRYLVLLSIPVTLALSCGKNHSNPTIIPGPPSLTTVPVSDITDTTAASGGTFSNQGTMTINIKGVQWDTDSQFPNHWFTSAGTGTGNFAANLNGLFPNTLYYVRAYAGTGTDSAHIWYGNTVQFTTTYTPGKYLVSTIAGTGAAGANNGDSSVATFNGPFGAAVDAAGNIYIADFHNNAIRKITPSGTVSTFGALAASSMPNDVITDTAGNVYVAEAANKIIKITPSGQASVFVGSGLAGSVTIAIDPAGNLYVGDRVAFRKITPAGVVSTLPNYLPRPNTSAAIGVDKNFNLYESDGSIVIKIDTFGNMTTLAGNGLGYVSEIRLDAAGNLYLADATANKIRMITPAGVLSTVAGTGAAGAKDGNSAIATFNGPSGLAVDNAGNIIVADGNNNKIRKISPL